jgi:DNA-binding beta-propeller fold protein YncE
MRKLAILSLSLFAMAALAAPVADAAPPPGGLNAVSCIGNPTQGPLFGCAADSASIAGLHDIALSPDGKQLYAVGGSQGDAIPGRLLTFARNADTGALTFAGCIGPAVAGCTADSHLGFSNALELSPDGTDLYVADYGGVVRYRRAADGGLTYAECATSSFVSGCDLAPGVAAASGVAVSPNGESVYVAGYIDDAVVAFSRNTGSGDLAWLGCQTTGSHPLCTATAGGGLDAATDVVVSPNGTRVYVSARNGNAVTTLDRAPSGAVSSPRVLAGDYLDGPQALAVAPEGNALYAGLFDGDGLTTLGLDPTTGDPSLLGCFMRTAASSCTASPGVNTVFGLTSRRAATSSTRRRATAARSAPSVAGRTARSA